jgi:hypothetical protein
MGEQTNEKRVKILTNSGFKYYGLLISEDAVFITIQDERQGRIKVPLANISFMQEVSNGN